MRKLLLFAGLLVTAASGASAQCTSKFGAVQAPSGNNVLNVNFYDSSFYGLPFSGQLKSYKIYFGDGTNSTGTGVGGGAYIVSHNYSSAGTRTVSFVNRSIDSVTGNVICSDSFARNLTITYPTCGTQIFASGTGASRFFSTFTPAGSSGMSYSWTFGDGGTGTGASITHTYVSNGTYTVTLTATSTSGCSYSNTMSITIYVPPPPLNCGSLHANFNTSLATNVLTTTNTSSTVSVPPYIMQATWDYGDGGTATAISPVAHTYSAPGIYTVKLRMVWRDSLLTSYCFDSVTHTVNVLSVPTPPNVISGNIIYDSTLGINYFKVWLVKYDSVTNLLSAVDSQVTASSYRPYYAFGNYPAGSYRTKAAVYGGAFTGTGLIPTYHDSSVYWNTATVINHTGGSTTNQRIYMRTGTLTSGPGFIGGNVSYGANKGTGNGVAGVMVFLRNSVMKVVKYTFTDSNGNYSFPNLPLAPYSVWPEVINYATTPATPIVLDNTGMSASSVYFNMDVAKRSIAPPGVLAVSGKSAAMPGISASPIPAHAEVMVSWTGTNGGAGKLVITTATGQVVKTIMVDNAAASGAVVVDVRSLAAGFYFLHGSGALSASPVKLIIQ